MDKPPHFSMIRGFHLADWFTIANAFCGMGAVLLAMAYLTGERPNGLIAACALVPAAFAFDVLDGRIARWRQTHSALGRELDSLADVISFGVTPACLAYAVGMTGLWDALILLYFVACGISRLARYNITAEQMSEETGKVAYFEGTPIPSSTLLVVLLVVLAWRGRIGPDLPFGVVALGPFALHPMSLLYLLSGSLMISKTLHIPKL